MNAQPGLTDARDLTCLLATTRQRLRRTWLASGAALTLVASVGWLTLAAGLDMILPMPVPMRVLAATVFWLLLGGTLLAAVIWPAVRPLRDMRVARLIEAVLPSMKNRLISCLDLYHRSSSHVGPDVGINRIFYQRLLGETRERLQNYRVEMVADPRLLRRASLAAVGVLLVLALMLGLFREAMPNAVARVLRPTAPIPPVSHVRIASPGDLHVLQGDPLTLTATLTRGDADSLAIRLQPLDQPPARYPMTRGVDAQGRPTFSFHFQRVQESFVYQIEGGGTWTRPARVHAMARPVIRQVTASLIMPDYMGLSGLTPVPPDATRISVPEGGMILITATVDHDPALGHVQTLQATTQTTERTDEQERVWIDDRLPSDAQVTDEATWVASPAFSGEASILLDESRPRIAFQTRLHELPLRREQALSLYVRADPLAPPSRIVLILKARGQKEESTWTLDASTLTPGQWVRVERSLSELGITALRNDTARISGLRMEVVGGRAHVDRIASLARDTRTRSQTQYTPLERLPMTRERADGPWTARVPVSQDLGLTLSFANAQGHESLPMAVWPVVAVKDQPPTVVVDKPGRHVTLDALEPVPLVLRALDDYGVDAVGVAYGTSGDAFDAPRWLRTFDQPQQSQLVLSVIDPSALGLTPDQPLRYRVVVRDRKGQIGQSPIHEIRLNPPQSQATSSPTRPVGSHLLEGLGRLLDVQKALAQAPVDLLRQLTLSPPGVEGSPDATLEPEQVQQLKQLQALLEQQHQMIEALRRQFAEAAARAQDSPLATSAEAQALAAMHQELGELARQGLPLSPETASALERMGQQLEAMDAARDQWAQDAEAAQAQMADALARMQAQQAAMQLSRLDQAIEAQKQVLEQLAGQIGQLQREAMTAPTAPAMAQVSQQQAQVDPQALAAMRQAQAVAEAGQLPQAQAMQDAMPPAPWTPPGRRMEGMPIEEDTPEENPAQGGSPSDARARTPDDPDGQNWWDQPVDTPPEAVTLEANPRFADRQRPVDAPPPTASASGPSANLPPETAPRAEDYQQPLTQNSNEPRGTSSAPANSPQAPTPRQLLVQHQGQMMQALQQSAQGLAQAQQQVGSLQQQMQALAQSPGPSSPPGQASQAVSAAAASPQMAAAAAMAQALAAAQQTRQAQAAASSASASSPSPSPATPQGPSLGPDRVQVGPGSLMVAELSDLPPERRATLYRLPAEVRQPLIRGMTEKGPDGYQPLIDAYFRSLLEADASSENADP